jgi:hypothetical protein
MKRRQRHSSDWAFARWSGMRPSQSRFATRCRIQNLVDRDRKAANPSTRGMKDCVGDGRRYPGDLDFAGPLTPIGLALSSSSTDLAYSHKGQRRAWPMKFFAMKVRLRAMELRERIGARDQWADFLALDIADEPPHRRPACVTRTLSFFTRSQTRRRDHVPASLWYNIPHRRYYHGTNVRPNRAISG